MLYAILLAAWAPILLRADEIVLESRRYPRATVRNFDGEFLIFADAAGQPVAKKLRDIQSIFVDSTPGLEDFNRGEKDRAEGRYAQAARFYELAFDRTRSFWRQLVQARLVESCDLSGQLDRAVEAFIELAGQLPDKADAHLPKNYAAASEAARDRSLKLLERATRAHDNQPAYWQLEALRLAIMEQARKPEAGTVARDLVTRLQSSRQAPRYRLQMIAIRVEVKHHQYDVALEHINKALQDAEREHLAELLLLKGTCLLGLARDRDGFLEAGLAFMRVIIHHPESPLCARSMYHAAEVHEKIDRPHKALELYRNCRELPGADDKLLQMADVAVQRLQHMPQ